MTPTLFLDSYSWDRASACVYVWMRVERHPGSQCTTVDTYVCTADIRTPTHACTHARPDTSRMQARTRTHTRARARARRPSRTDTQQAAQNLDEAVVGPDRAGIHGLAHAVALQLEAHHSPVPRPRVAEVGQELGQILGRHASDDFERVRHAPHRTQARAVKSDRLHPHLRHRGSDRARRHAA